ncbi:MAG: SDR family oxidoreductase [Paracoccus sp. (in: a-proteobacteria)]|nr:SDR family oxidoreductase [Paracoccus sp. (in: a-proteobacteria)]
MSDRNWLAARFGLAGKRVLITGASRGIGRAMALGFARAGADLILAARDTHALQGLADEIAAIGATARCLRLDQRDLTLIEATIAEAGPVDVLVNNAGVEELRPSLDVDEALWNKILDTNLKGAFFVARAVAKGMVKGRGGAIINLASLTSFVGVAGAVPYTASKSGVLGMTRALSTEWAARGIRVNAIAPGYFQTGMTDVFYENKDWVAAMTAKVPMGRLGALDDLIGAGVFLASDAARYITGQCITVDGGYLAAL